MGSQEPQETLFSRPKPPEVRSQLRLYTQSSIRRKAPKNSVPNNFLNPQPHKASQKPLNPS